MKFNKILCSILAGTYMCTLNVEANNKPSDDVIAKCIVGTTIGLPIIAVSAVCIRNKFKKNKEIKRRREETAKLPNGKIRDIVEALVDIIPISKKDNSLFDKLLKCEFDDDIRDWAGIDVAISDWNSNTLIKVDHVLTTKHIISDVLKHQIDIAWRKEAEEAKNTNMFRNNGFGLLLSFDKGVKLTPVFQF